MLIYGWRPRILKSDYNGVLINFGDATPPESPRDLIPPPPPQNSPPVAYPESPRDPIPPPPQNSPPVAYPGSSRDPIPPPPQSSAALVEYPENVGNQNSTSSQTLPQQGQEIDSTSSQTLLQQGQEIEFLECDEDGDVRYFQCVKCGFIWDGHAQHDCDEIYE